MDRKDFKYIHIPKDVHKELKIRSAEAETTMHAYLKNLLSENGSR